MNVEVFCLCDGANDSRGKLNILGVFDRIASQTFPATHPQFVVAARIRHDSSIASLRRVAIEVHDPNGDVLFHPPTLEISFGKADVHGSSTAQAIFYLRGCAFATPGKYKVVMTLDGKEIARLPLYVTEADAKE